MRTRSADHRHDVGHCSGAVGFRSRDSGAVEGTSEASLAASAPRVAQMLYQPKNRAQDLAGRTADCQCEVGTGTAAAAKGLLGIYG